MSGACIFIYCHTFFALTISVDYQGFASENSEKLARAIEKGIPNNLRGMVWQLM